jgi:hypothetical protein
MHFRPEVKSDVWIDIEQGFSAGRFCRCDGKAIGSDEFFFARRFEVADDGF